VETVEPSPQGARMLFRVNVEIARGWRIPRDSIGRRTATGPLAPEVIAIAAGSAGEALKPGEEIQTQNGGDIFSSLSSAAGDVDKLTNQGLLPLLDNLNQQVTSIGGLFNNDIRKLVGNANAITGPAAQDMPVLLRDLRQITGNLAEVSQRLRGVTDPEHMAEIDRILANADHATQHLEKASTNLEALSGTSGRDLQVSLAELRRSADLLSQHVEAIVQNLDATSRNMNEFSRQIRRDPSLVLRGSPPADQVPETQPAGEKK